MNSSRGIRNPYEKTAKPDEAGQKRSVRPWESSTTGSSSALRPGASSLQDQLGSNNRNESFDGFDCGIDWDAALRTLEDQAVFDGKVPSTKPKISTMESNITQTNNNYVAKPVEESFRAKENTTSGKVNVKEDAVSSLRPASWKGSTTQTSNHVDIRIQNRCIDPDQDGLPQNLQFTKNDVKAVCDEHQKDLVKNAAINEPLLNGWTLYNHQKRAILKALAMRRCILALDMGLGKTLIGCVWAKAFLRTLNIKVLVLCPVSLQEEWKRTMENAVGLSVQELHGASKKKSLKENANLDDTEAKVSIYSWSKIPSVDKDGGYYVVIADEAHSMQSMQAARTKDTLSLVSSRQCCGVLLLTGTPMKNGKPSNLFPLLKAVNHPLGRHQKSYEAHFCAGREVNFGRGRVWQATGASNLDQLQKLIKSHMLHLTKEACLTDLPPLSRTFVKVPVSSRRKMQHNNAMQELLKVYENQKSGPDEKILGAVQKVRMVGSLAKVEAAVEQAKSILQEQPAVVIFTSFQEVAKQVHRQLSEAGWDGELLTGETPAKKRQAMVDNFQKGLSPVFCCTFGAGGVGLTLTAAHSIILLDRPWTPGDAAQAEDRVRRIGQTKPVRSIWLRAFDLDEQIDGMIEHKRLTSDAVLTEGNTERGGDEHSAPRLSIFQLIKSILPAKQDGFTQTSILQFSQEVG